MFCVKKHHFFADFFGENIFKIITSVTRANPTSFKFSATAPALQWDRAFLQ
jgi:hypothetical protein